MTARRLLVHHGTFAVLDAGGDVHGEHGTSPDGLFVRDARHLSRWRLTLDGTAPTVLRAAGDTDTAAVLTPRGSRDEPPDCTLVRQQALWAGCLTERIQVLNNTARARTPTLRIEVDADFSDQFELRGDGRHFEKPGAAVSTEDRPDGVRFTYRRGTWHSTTTIGALPPPTVGPPRPDTTGRTLTWRLDLPPHGTRDLLLTVTARAHGAPPPPGPPPRDPAAAEQSVRNEENTFVRTAPLPLPLPLPTGDLPSGSGEVPPEESGPPCGPGGAPPDRSAPPGGRHDTPLARACAQGLADLARLRVPATGPDGELLYVPGAGVPWFLTLFGRDSLLTSLFALPYRPGLAEATLRALAATQATEELPERVAQPGKIVHELRHGELAHFGQVPYGRYYGSVDSTPLFLVLLAAHAEQTRDTALARRLEPHARAAADWMFTSGGLGTHGYLVYEADAQGLANQNWKDSQGAICSRDGTQATGAIAVSEVQGYAYDALRRTAALARTVWHDTAWARRLDGAATDLKARFDADFWLPGQNFPALALDGHGRPADALASDAGHLLWSGILDADQARAVGRRLLQPDFFSGWGIRTLAEDQDPYHPLSYHRGSIWPHDNALIVLGLARHGLHDEAARVAGGLLDTAAYFGHRLPEVLAGYPRTGPSGPVPYPHANSPQAWAAATPLALLTAARAGRTRS